MNWVFSQDIYAGTGLIFHWTNPSVNNYQFNFLLTHLGLDCNWFNFVLSNPGLDKYIDVAHFVVLVQA